MLFLFILQSNMFHSSLIIYYASKGMPVVGAWNGLWIFVLGFFIFTNENKPFIQGG